MVIISQPAKKSRSRRAAGKENRDFFESLFLVPVAGVEPAITGAVTLGITDFFRSRVNFRVNF